jgi:uncharacterized lipoprotein YmbA
MSMRIVIMVIVAGICCWLVSACMNLGPSTSPATRFYLLESRINASMHADTAGGLKDIVVGIRPVEIPAYLDRSQLVTRLDGNELRVDEFSQWAEPLGDSISRVIEQNLHLLTGSRQLVAAITWHPSEPDLLLSMDVLGFEADAAGEVTLNVAWQISRPDGPEILIEKRSILSQPSTGAHTDEIVESMSVLLADLSREMADALAEAARLVKPAS